MDSRLQLNYDHLFHFSGANKAGMQDMDRKKQSETIYEMSKNSAFFKNALDKDSKTDEKISSILGLVDKVKADRYRMIELQSEVSRDLALNESKRNLSRVCSVLDMDMFYAAVEIRDQPDLVDKPVAVGGSDMICTANYVARKFGVRSAMPGFIAKKLCPEVVFISPNFDKYIAVSNVIKSIIKEYDPNFHSMSLDEVYFDITDICTSRMRKLMPEESQQSPEYLCRRMDLGVEVVAEIRAKIFTETGGLTASAGVAANFLLAKILADVKKPNGQSMLLPLVKDITEFMFQLPVRKIPGIGKVTEKILTALEISTVSDMHASLPLLLHALSSTQYHFFLHNCLGISRGEVDADLPVAEGADSRKSLGCSRTFKPTADRSEWIDKLRQLAESVCAELKNKQLQARTVTVKIKTAAFDESTRRRTVTRPLSLVDDVFDMSCKLLGEPWPTAPLRLLGITLSSFITMDNGTGLSRYFRTIDPEEQTDCTVSLEHSGNSVDSFGDSEGADGCWSTLDGAPSETALDPPMTAGKLVSPELEANEVDCPVCGRPLSGTLSAINIHVNTCLSLSEASSSASPRKRKAGQSSVVNFLKRN